MDSRPLRDLTVVEIGAAVAGPFGGKVLSDHGARVVKIEPKHGEILRHRNKWYDEEAGVPETFTYRFMQYNTGKESIAVDLKSDEGNRVLWDLLETADVLLVNMRPGTMDRLGYSWDEMHERNPELIYCSITGYGEDGPYTDWPAYDYAVQGSSGWAAQNEANGRPRAFEIVAVDHSTALTAVSGILMAVIERERSGEGQRIDTAMIETATSFLGHHLAELSAGRVDDGVAERMFQTKEDDVYETADGHMVVIIEKDYFESFARAIDREEWLEDHQFSTITGRKNNFAELRAELTEIFSQRPTTEWIDHFQSVASDVVAAPVNQIPDLTRRAGRRSGPGSG